VPYVSRRAREGTYYYPFVWLYVTDLSDRATFSGFLPFLIDTGATVTVIPRFVLPEYAFQPASNAIHSIRGVGMSATPGLRFPALLSIAPRQRECVTLTFDPIDVFVSDLIGPRPFGLLGLDAIRQTVAVFDAERARIRRPDTPPLTGESR
jgi:hypothetical protein